MNAPARTFEAKPAKRESVPLLVGLMGPSGSGKTFSALRLATGIQTVTGGDVYGIDTESRRMLHYSDLFRFKHVQFDAPFGSLDYLAALRYTVKQGARVIIVDSMSHEHESTGGLLDTHERELDRLAGDDWAKRERVKMLAWQKPKANRRELITGLLQLNANFIFCFRAKQSVRPVKIAGKIEIVPQGFMPIAGEEFLFEQTVNILLLPKSGGVPTWETENVGERMMIKPAAQFQTIFKDRRPLDEEHGQRLAEWARGSERPSHGAESPSSAPPAAPAPTDPVAARAGAAPTPASIPAPIPTAAAYVERWHGLLDAAVPKQREQLAKTWNIEKKLRQKITWPDDDTFPLLRERVKAALEALQEDAAL